MPGHQLLLASLRRILLCMLLNVIGVGAAIAQASRFEGIWAMDVQGANRPRTVVISQENGSVRVVYGWKDADGKLGPTESTLDAGGVLTIKTRADSVIVVRLIDDNTLKGQMTTGGGKVLVATLTRDSPGAPVAIAARPDAAPNNLSSQSTARVFMSKAEVEATFIGKKHVFTDVPSGSVVRWDLREGGRVFYNNMTTRNNGSGTWEILDDGGLCVRMDGGRQCNYFFHEGDKLVRANNTNATEPIRARIDKFE